MGDHPTGYVIFTPEGRLVNLSAEGRQAAESNADRAELLSSMIAYTGTYRLEDDRWITQVDVAWNPNGSAPSRPASSGSKTTCSR